MVLFEVETNNSDMRTSLLAAAMCKALLPNYLGYKIMLSLPYPSCLHAGTSQLAISRVIKHMFTKDFNLF